MISIRFTIMLSLAACVALSFGAFDGSPSKTVSISLGPSCAPGHILYRASAAISRIASPPGLFTGIPVPVPRLPGDCRPPAPPCRDTVGDTVGDSVRPAPCAASGHVRSGLEGDCGRTTLRRECSLPPGIDADFLRELAAECPAVDEDALSRILEIVWRVCKEERYHYMRALAQIRAESDFNPGLVSSAGALGLMQVLPKTAEFMGFNDISAPEDNVRCGIRYMKWLERFVRHSTARERWLATLAAYNSGPARYLEMVRRTLARYGHDEWAYVAKTYRRRYRPAKGSKLPETLIYIRRNLESLKLFQARLFKAHPLPEAGRTIFVRIPAPGDKLAALTD